MLVRFELRLLVRLLVRFELELLSKFIAALFVLPLELLLLLLPRPAFAEQFRTSSTVQGWLSCGLGAGVSGLDGRVPLVRLPFSVVRPANGGDEVDWRVGLIEEARLETRLEARLEICKPPSFRWPFN